MSRRSPLLLCLAILSVACGDTAHRPIPSGAPGPRLSSPAPTPTVPTAGPGGFSRLSETAAGSPLELTAAPVEGYPPLPTYFAKIRNVSGRPVRRVLATVVYLDGQGRAMPGENHDVEFGSPLKAIDPGVTLETSFLSRVERAPGVRLVIREVTFLEKGPGAEPVPREWKNPRYEADLAALHGAPPVALP